MRTQGGWKRLGVFLAAVLGVVMTVQAAPRVSDENRVEDAQAPAIRPMSDGEQQSAGCIVSAAAAMGATYVAGPSELVMLVVGGVIVPSSSSVLFLSLMGTMASLACAAGATITPLVTRVWRESHQEQGAADAAGAPPPKDEGAQASSGDQEGPSDTLKQGIGCVVAGTGAATYATLAGATETLMVSAGGLLVPSAASTLWLGLMSTLLAGTCSLGAAATPAVLWAFEQKDNIGASLAYQASRFVDSVRTAAVVEAAPPAGNAVATAPFSAGLLHTSTQ